jgi:hypothetical protein
LSGSLKSGIEAGLTGWRRRDVQALIQLLAGFIIMLATAALAQFGVSLSRASEPEREVHRVVDCTPAASASRSSETPRDC